MVGVLSQSISNSIPSTGCSRNGLWRKKFSRKTQSCLVGGFSGRAQGSHCLWVLCLRAATWPGRLRQTDEAGFCSWLTATFCTQQLCQGSETKKSPLPRMTHFRRERLTQTRQRINKTWGQCWPCSGLLQEENLNTKAAFRMPAREGRTRAVPPGPLYSHNSSGLRDMKALRSKGRQVTDEAWAHQPPSSWSTCTNHSRRQMPHGASMPTEDRPDFCFPILIWENHMPHGAPFIYNTLSIIHYLRITVHSQQNVNRFLKLYTIIKWNLFQECKFSLTSENGLNTVYK